MNSYETSAIVQAQGRILVVGLPFAPGTQVEVTFNPMPSVVLPAAQMPDRAERLLDALGKVRNVEPITAFNREWLYMINA